jgi:hypothetical protein
MPNVFKAIVDGLGSKRLAAVLAAVVAVPLALVLQKYLTLDPSTTLPMIGSILIPVVLFVLSQWHLDKVSGGQTTTAYRLTLGTAQAIEKVAKDGTLVDQIARQVIKAMQDADPPGAALEPAPVPPASPSP